MPVKTIFFIENNQEILSALALRLQHTGFQLLVARDFGNTLPEVQSAHPDLVVLDVDMLGIDGFAIFEAMRSSADPLLLKVPVMLICANGDAAQIDRARKLGIVDYFVKTNFNPDDAVAKLLKQMGVPEAHSPDATPPVRESINSVVAQGPIAPEPPSSAEKIIKILIVEDDKFLRDLAVQKLSKEHLQVASAVDGEQGLLVAEKEIPNIILLDILLPGIDGFEVLKRLRANPMFAKTSIAMLSNFGQREDVEKALTSGADQFFIKANYTLDEIVDEVKKIAATPRQSK